MNLSLQHKLLFICMKEQIVNNFHNEYDRHKELFAKITRRGPEAFQTLLTICLDNFPKAAYILATQ